MRRFIGTLAPLALLVLALAGCSADSLLAKQPPIVAPTATPAAALTSTPTLAATATMPLPTSTPEPIRVNASVAYLPVAGPVARVGGSVLVRVWLDDWDGPADSIAVRMTGPWENFATGDSPAWIDQGKTRIWQGKLADDALSRVAAAEFDLHPTHPGAATFVVGLSLPDGRPLADADGAPWRFALSIPVYQ